jgi:hypothetical protein
MKEIETLFWESSKERISEIWKNGIEAKTVRRVVRGMDDETITYRSDTLHSYIMYQERLYLFSQEMGISCFELPLNNKMNDLYFEIIK